MLRSWPIKALSRILQGNQHFLIFYGYTTLRFLSATVCTRVTNLRLLGEDFLQARTGKTGMPHIIGILWGIFRHVNMSGLLNSIFCFCFTMTALIIDYYRCQCYFFWTSLVYEILSLSRRLLFYAWFERHLYIPLGGSRCNVWITKFNFVAIWHDLEWWVVLADFLSLS